MTKRKNPVISVWRKRFSYERVWLISHTKPIVSLCYKQFSRVTGLKLKPGESKRIRINVEVVNDAR